MRKLIKNKSNIHIKIIVPLMTTLMLLLSALPAGAVYAAPLSSLNVGGTAVSISQNSSGANWWYNNSYSGSGLGVLTLVGFGENDPPASKPNITATGDLIIAAADFNHIGTLDVNGSVIITGTGVLTVESIIVSGSLSASGAALFVKSGGSYILQNNSVVYDWATLPAGDFVIPAGRTLNFAVYKNPRSGGGINPVGSTTAYLDVPAASNLIVESGGKIIVEKFEIGADYYRSVIEVQGTLNIKNGGIVLNDGWIQVDTGSVICEGTGVIDCNNNNGHVFLFAKEGGGEKSKLALNIRDGVLFLAAGTGEFDGGVNYELSKSQYGVIEITDTTRTKEVVLDYINFKGTKSDPDERLHIRSCYIHAYPEAPEPANGSRYFYSTIGRMKVNEGINSNGNLNIESAEIRVGAGGVVVEASVGGNAELQINSAALACNGPLKAGKLITSYATLNLSSDPVVNTTQSHNNVIAVSPTGLPNISTNSKQQTLSSTTMTDTIYRTCIFTRNPALPNMGTFIEKMCSVKNHIPADASDVQIVDLNDSLPFSWAGVSSPPPGLYDALVGTDEEFTKGDVLRISLEDLIPWYPGDPRAINDFKLTYFILIGKDSGSLRVWYIYPNSPMPDVQELYMIFAVNYFSSSAGLPAPGSSENHLQSDNTGSGVLGGGGGGAMCTAGVHSVGANGICSSCGANLSSSSPPATPPPQSTGAEIEGVTTPMTAELPDGNGVDNGNPEGGTSGGAGTGSTTSPSTNTDDEPPLVEVDDQVEPEAGEGAGKNQTPFVLIPIIAGGGIGSLAIILKVIKSKKMRA